jgi:hypothetical protein
MRNALGPIVSVVLALSGCQQPDECNGDAQCTSSASTVMKGRIEEQPGQQTQSFGGSGSIAASTQVQVGTLNADGSLQVVASTAVMADGHYTLMNVPSGKRKLIVQALDAAGNATASVIVQASGNASGDVVTVAPMNTETSIEAEVFAAMLASGVSIDDANAIDLRARINTPTAVAIKAMADAGADAKAAIKGLALAIAVAQRAQLKAYAQLGVSLTESSLFDLQLAAAVKLDAALDAGTASSQAYVDFLVALDAAVEAKGADAEKRARGESCASAALRATLRARLDVSAHAVVDAALRSAASLEARTTTLALEAALTAGAASSAVMSAATTAEAKLRADVSAAADFTADAAAYTAFGVALTGNADVMTSVLGQYLGVDVTTKATAQAAVSATASAAATLDASLSAAVQATGSVDVDAVAQAVVGAYATFTTSVSAQATALASFGAKAEPTVTVLIAVDGSLRLRSE